MGSDPFLSKTNSVCIRCGASLLTLAQNYLRPIQYIFPIFLFNQALATATVIIGGIFNIFGDYFFAFGLNMGIEGVVWRRVWARSSHLRL